MIGQVLGHYRVLEKIGTGGMGEVYRAIDDRLGRDVAIKVLKPSVAHDTDRLRRFEQEARAAADSQPLPPEVPGADVDSDGDGLSDFQEIHKYRTDPKK